MLELAYQAQSGNWRRLFGMDDLPNDKWQEAETNRLTSLTNGAVAHGGTTTNIANGTLIGDGEPFFDQCSNSSTPLNPDGSPGGVTVSMNGTNIGDLMNSDGMTWGWFQGGFTPSSFGPGDRAICGTSHANIAGAVQ